MVNYVAVLVAAVASFVVGMLWYSPLLFGKQWMKWSGIKEPGGNVKKSMFFALVFALVTAYVLAWFVSALGAGTVTGGMIVGFWAWLGFFVTTQAGSVLWEGKPWKLYFLNIAYSLVNLLVMGAILGAW